MVIVAEELKELYLGSSIPKQLYIEFPSVTLSNDKIFEFTLEEALSSSTELIFGSCVASQFKARVVGVGKDIVGQRCRIYQIVDGTYYMPIGVFTIDSVSRKDDYGYREIIGYDDIYEKLDIDVADWYKSLALPMPLKTFRQSLFAYAGIQIETQELINDDMTVERTIEPKTLNGRTVAVAIGEISGTFGHIGRYGQFKYISLGSTGLYPSEDLYPSEELYPSEADAMFSGSSMFTCTQEDYEVQAIDCLQIRQQEGDVGCTVYDSRNYANPYIITGNFLVYGKTAEQLEVIARNVFNHIKGIPYTPFEVKAIGLPYLEVGDGVTFDTKSNSFCSFVLKRTLSGIQSLRDMLSASGNQYRENKVSPNDEIEMLKGRSMIIQKSVDGLKVTVTDLEQSTETRFEQTASAIKLEAERATGAEEELSAKLQLTAEQFQVSLKNTANELSGQIDLTAEQFQVSLKNTEENLMGEISLTAEDLSARIEKGEDEFSEFKQTVDGWTFTTAAGKTKISGDMIETGIIKGVTTLFVENNSLYWACGADSFSGIQRNAEWACDSNAIYSNAAGERTVQIYRDDDGVGKIALSDTNEGYTAILTPYYYSSKWRGFEAQGFKATSLWCDYGYSDSWDSSSDIRLKDGVKEITWEEAEFMVDNFSPSSFYFKSDKEKKRRFGFIADSVKNGCEKLYGEKIPLLGTSPDGFLTLSYDDFIAVLWKQVQILKKEMRGE